MKMSDVKGFQNLSEDSKRFIKMCEEFKPSPNARTRITNTEKHICQNCGKEFDWYGVCGHSLISDKWCDECIGNDMTLDRHRMTFNNN